MKPGSYLRQLACSTLGVTTLPPYLIFFVTERCNLSCRHCFFSGKEKRLEEMTTEECRLWSRHLKGLQVLVISGGEPFLRGDIADIITHFSREASLRKAVVVTNGWHTARIVAAVEKVMRDCPRLHLGVSVSLDGKRELHDAIRGCAGSFDRAVESYLAVRRLETGEPAGHRRVSATINITISKENQDQLPELYAYLRDEVGADDITVCLARKAEPRSGAAAGVDTGKYKALISLMEADKKTGKLRGFRDFSFSWAANAKDSVSREIIGETARELRPALPCLAGRMAAVVRQDGEVFPCEHLFQSMGNLREHGWDFRALWNSRRAIAVRSTINKKSCFCLHECFNTVNIAYQPRGLWRLVKKVVGVPS